MSEITNVTNEIVSSARELYGPILSQILLFGSYARGDYDDQSDVDIMIVLDCNNEDVSKYRRDTSRMASRIGLRNDVEVSLMIRDKDSFERYQAVSPFYNTVSREGIVLYG